MTSDTHTTEPGRRCIRRLDDRYVIPTDIEVVRVIGWEHVANQDGGTGMHWEYICLVEEVAK